MADKAWKAFERKVARWFGTVRNSLSGMNSKLTGSDTLHDVLYIECKKRAKSAVVSLWEKTNTKARAEKKIPVIALSVNGKKGFWICVKEEDLQAVANQRELARKDGAE